MRYILPVLPIILGFIFDLIIGDPYNLPHPIRAIGKLISILESRTRKNSKNLRKGGIILALEVIFISVFIPLLILLTCYKIHIILGILIESIFCFYLIAPRCLYNESMKVCKKIESDDIEGARQAVSMIVGRDTEKLDKDGIIRATVETVAENSSDGVTAPIFYMAFGGAIMGFFYKATNTLDSMIGYKNEKYVDIGRFSAKLDDVMNFIPSRLTALLTVFTATILGMDGKNAMRIWRRDRNKHASPNAGQTESAFAGALHIRLAGDIFYFGKLHKKPYIGDNDRKILADDIKRANKLMYGDAVFMLILAIIFRILFFGVII